MGAVVNDQTKSVARLFPARSSIPLVSRAVYVVFGLKLLEGVNVAVRSVSVTWPATAPTPAPLSRNVAVVTDEGPGGSESIAVTAVPVVMPVAPFCGVTAAT